MRSSRPVHSFLECSATEADVAVVQWSEICIVMMNVEPPQWLSYLEGPTDEHRVAGLLMAARYLTGQRAIDVGAVRTVTKEQSGENEEEERFCLSDAQRAGIEVVGSLSRADPDEACGRLAQIAWEPAARLVEKAADARLRAQGCDIDDLTRCLECRAALRIATKGPASASGAHGLAILAADVDLLPDPASTLATDLLGSAMYDGGYMLTSMQVDSLVRAAEHLAAASEEAASSSSDAARRSEKGDKSSSSAAVAVKESMLLEIVASTLLRRRRSRNGSFSGNHDVASDLEDLRSSRARASTLAAFEAVSKSIPRLLLAGVLVPVQVRDSAIRLALTLTRAFGVEWLGEGRGSLLKLLARIVASELRLSLDEALSFVEDGKEIDRIANMAPVCLSFLEAVVQGLVGDRDDEEDQDRDSDDEEEEEEDLSRSSPLVHLVDTDSILAVREALSDATEASLAFVGEMKLRRDAAALENVLFEDSPSLHVCRECFRFLGRIAVDLEDEGRSDSVHSRLASLSPFVAELMALHQYQSGRTPTL